jgi:AcrR family transcriptional regulator
MPRTRTISDQKVLNATIELVGRHGVEKLTFASLGAHIGLSPATLVQRFGTKQQLLAAVTRYCLESMPPTFANAKGGSPLQAMYAAFGTMAKAVTSVEEFANGQVFFYLALTDSATNILLHKSMAESRNAIQQLLDEAVKLKEINPCNTAVLALTLQTVYEGAITTWLVYQQGSVESWVLNQLEAVIEPYRIVIKGE